MRRLHQLYPDKGYMSAVGRVAKNLPESVSYFPEDFSDMLIALSTYESIKLN